MYIVNVPIIYSKIIKMVDFMFVVSNHSKKKNNDDENNSFYN